MYKNVLNSIIEYSTNFFVIVTGFDLVQGK